MGSAMGVLVLMGSAAAAQPAAPAHPDRPVPQTPRVLWKVALGSNSFGGGAIADADGDGILDVAFATYFGDSRVRVLAGTDGHEVWSHDAGEGAGTACLDASCRFADVNGDGVLELVVPVSNTSRVIAFEGATGRPLWTYEAGQGECIDTPPWVGDIDGDGGVEIVVGTFKSRLHVIRGADGAPVRVVQIAPRGAVQSCPIVTDLNGDDVKDFIAATFRGDDRVAAVDGSVAEAPLGDDHGPRPVHELWHVQTGSHIYHGPSVGDLDGDGRADFAVGSYDGKVYAFRADGSSLWTASPGERYIMAPTVMADLDGDGRAEVVATGERVTAIRADGSTMWSERFDAPGTYWAISRGVSVADLDGDGRPDLAALNGRGLFKVLRGADGATLAEFDAARIHERTMTSVSHLALIADLDGEPGLEVFFVVGGDMQDRHGLAVCLTGFAGRAVNADGSLNGWFMHRHDPLNTGNLSTALPPELRARILGPAARASSAPARGAVAPVR